jgi:diguanylate cyclase (GGDEF)-like protein
MAASDSTPRTSPAAAGIFDWPGPPELEERLEEEISRAERHGTGLSCLMVVVDNLEEMGAEHGGELREQTLVYIAGALRRELRSFDRVGMPAEHELLIVLPGADGPRGEMVARRVLERLRAIKVEARGQREPLRVSVGLAPWRPDTTPAMLLDRARAAAARRGNGEPALGERELGPAEPPAASS